jgi:hypothetical protein
MISGWDILGSLPVFHIHSQAVFTKTKSDNTHLIFIFARSKFFDFFHIINIHFYNPFCIFNFNNSSLPITTQRRSLCQGDSVFREKLAIGAPSFDFFAHLVTFLVRRRLER